MTKKDILIDFISGSCFIVAFYLLFCLAAIIDQHGVTF
jgi:hypothetical protein